MITSQYFNARMTAAQMKASYKDLVKQYHPDINHGISDEFIKAINNEFSYMYARAASKEVYETKSTENPSKDYTRYTSQAYIDSLESMINWIYSNNIDRIPSITLEIIGVFIWISGVKAEDREIREQIKSVGFQGSFKVQDNGESIYMWKWTPEIRRFNGEHNIDTIRKHYGTMNYKRSGNTQKRLG